MRAAVDAMGGGAGRILGLLGDPGIGKTSLLLELAEVASHSGRLVLWGTGSELERRVPFGIFTNALDDHLAAADVAGLGGDRLRLLGQVFPSLEVPPGDPGTGLLEAERYRLHRAARALLEVLAKPSGVVVILDDLHWIDDGSIELLDHLARHPPCGPVLLAVGYRPRQTSGRLRHTLAGAVRHGRAELLELGALTPDESAALLPADISAPRRQALCEISGGNPFYLDLLSRATGAADGPVAGSDRAGDPWLPARIALDAELSGLAPAQLEVAHAAAVAGEVFDATLVGPVAGRPLADVLAALDGLAGRDLVRPAGPAGRFRFRHPLVRWAAYQHAGAGWRLAAHARAASALREYGAPVTEQAHHVELSASQGDLAAVEVLEKAAVAAAHATPANAAYWLKAALRLLPDEPATAGVRVRLLSRRAQVLGLSGHLEASRHTLDQVLYLMPADGSVPRVEAVAFRAMVDHLLGRHAEGRALLRNELRRLPDPSGAAATVLRLAIASAGAANGDAALPCMVDLVRDARRTGDRLLVASALGLSAVIGYSLGTCGPDTTAALDEAAGTLDALGDVELAGRLSAALWVGWAEMYGERLDDAVRHLDRAVRICRATGQSYLIGALHLFKGIALGQRGDLVGAAAALDDGWESARLIGSAEMTSRALAYRCWVKVLMGQTGDALALGEQAAATVLPGQDWNAGSAPFMLALAFYHAGDPVGCVRLLTRAGGGPGLPAVRANWQPVWFELLAAAETAAGRGAQGAGWAARARGLRIAPELSRQQGFVELAQAHPTLATDPAAALSWASRAADTFARADDPVNAGRANALAAVALGLLGQVGTARERFARARDLFDACGATVLHEQAVREERRMNARLPRRSDRDAPLPTDRYGLTARERDAVEFLLAGLTNRQIAGKLHVSPKTVESHLSRVYAKLGVSSRAAVAAIWSAARPADPTYSRNVPAV